MRCPLWLCFEQPLQNRFKFSLDASGFQYPNCLFRLRMKGCVAEYNTDLPLKLGQYLFNDRMEGPARFAGRIEKFYNSHWRIT